MTDDVLRERVLNRDGHKCRNCRRDVDEVDLHAHHIVPKRLGGKDSLSNVVALCEVCHKKAHDHEIGASIMEGVKEAQREGKWTGRPPIGFETNDDGYLVVEVEESKAACDALGR